MVTLRSAAVIGLAGLIFLAAGCAKKVELTFVNTTDESRPVELTVPGEGTRHLGVVPHTAGQLTCDLKVDNDLLPAICSWRAGDRGDAFTVDKKTPDELMIYIRPAGNIGPVTKDTEIEEERQVEVQEVPIHREEVIE